MRTSPGSAAPVGWLRAQTNTVAEKPASDRLFMEFGIRETYFMYV
jgi:hypothetical protein